MKRWPPKPGLTLITSTRSTSSSTHSSMSSGCAGLNASPALQPSARIRRSVRSACVEASAWNVITFAPAAAKAEARVSTGRTIRWTSSGTFAPPARMHEGLIACAIAGPIVRLGT